MDIAAALRAARRFPHDRTRHLILADRFDEAGDGRSAEQLRLGPPPVVLAFLRPGSGGGCGYGDCEGDGFGGGGPGYGSVPRGGGGSGFAYRYGAGDGAAYPTPVSEVGAMPEVGMRMLIVLPHGWVVCGDVAEQTGPYRFRVENAHVVARTGGVPWDELADGRNRSRATFRRWGTVFIGPSFVMSREWAGELPEVA